MHPQCNQASEKILLQGWLSYLYNYLFSNIGDVWPLVVLALTIVLQWKSKLLSC